MREQRGRRAAWFGAAAALLLVGLTACSDDSSPEGVTREVDPFTRVIVSGSVDVTITVGDETSVRIVADDEIADRVATTSSSGFLSIVPDEGLQAPSGAEVLVTTPTLEGVISSGSATVRAAGVSSAAFDVESAGSGRLEVQGAAEELTVSSMGSGPVDARSLTAQQVTVLSGGSGDIDVTPVRSLVVQSSGEGDITYAGDPTVEVQVTGTGTVSKR